MQNQAMQQMTGFQEAITGGTWIGLCMAMGLTEEEWEHIKTKQEVNWMNLEAISEINQYFKSEAEK